VFSANVEYRNVDRSETLDLSDGIIVRTAPLNHPGGATGYRIDHAGRSVAYIADTEFGDGPTDQAVLALAKGASLVIIDATYTDKEIPSHIGWGHSTWQQCVQLAEAAGAEKLCLFHHDPDHDDTVMDAIAAAAGAARPGTIVAREGLRIDL
jgi:phosphoribosyl 1,2-cyclic phosphodiesterase